MTQRKLNQKVLTQINSDKNEEVLKGISAIRESGCKEYIKPICDIYVQNNNNDIKKEISKLINDIKESSTREIIIEILTDTSSNDLRMMLLASCWLSRNDYNNYLVNFVEIAIKYDYLEALEALTIIENFENIPAENDIDESISMLKSEITKEEKGKQQLLYEFIKVLENYKNSYLE